MCRRMQVTLVARSVQLPRSICDPHVMVERAASLCSPEPQASKVDGSHLD
jgi:hypothetical protein